MRIKSTVGTGISGCVSVPDPSRFDKFIANAERAPRLTSLLPFFRDTALGLRNAPAFGYATGDVGLFRGDTDAESFENSYVTNMGVFERHFASSVPYILENECRVGSAILRYCKLVEASRDRPLRTFHIGSSEAPLARTLAELGGGIVKSLAHSDTKEHAEGYFRKGVPENSWFRALPLIHITPDWVGCDPNLAAFYNGFDIILEHQTFQFYGIERAEQIDFVSENFADRQTGILILTEKFRHSDPQEYARREEQKDAIFKARFFSETQIEEKKAEVLTTMGQQEVTLRSLVTAIKYSFESAVLVWNSGNFSTIVCSNDSQRLKNFVKCLLPPCIPDEFSNEIVPQTLVGRALDLDFRQPSGCLEDESSVLVEL